MRLAGDIGSNNFLGVETMVGIPGRSGGDRWNDGVDRTADDGGPRKPDLPDAVGKKWDELVEQLPSGSLRKIDGHELRILAELLAMADSMAEACRRDPSDHRAARVFLNVVGQVHRLSASFGLNPGDRKRLAIAPVVEDESDFASMLRRRMA